MQELDINNLPEFLVPREVAFLLRLSPLTVKRWVKAGKLKATRINTRGDMRFDRNDVLELLKKMDK